MNWKIVADSSANLLAEVGVASVPAAAPAVPRL